MSLSSVWRTLLRRWYVTLIGLLITAGLVYAAAVLSPPTYQARASVLLIPPKSGQQSNPYLGLGGLQEVSDVLSRAVSDTATTDAVTAAGGSPKYSVARDTSTTGPIILVTAEAGTAAGALHTDRLLIERMGPSLSSLQASQNVPSTAYISLITLSADQKAAVQRKSQLRACIAGGAVGLLLTVLLVAFAEKTANRRSRRAATEGTGELRHAAPARGGRRRKAERGGPEEASRDSEPVSDERVVDERLDAEPVATEPVAAGPVTDEPVTDEPAADEAEPVADEATKQRPANVRKRPATSGSRSRTHG